MRRATVEDTDALSDFVAVVISTEDTPDEGMRAWAKDLMRGALPGFSPGDTTLVEDTKTGRIASTQNLISQRWSYGGIEFGAGRIELVGTHPDYRRRGLVRAQMDVVHQWSAERGELVQGITGIPWFYRQFGYELAIEQLGGRAGHKSLVPQLAPGQPEPYRVRPATEADLSYIARVYRHGMQRYPVACVRDEEMWRYDLLERGQFAGHRNEIRIVEAAGGAPVSFFLHRPALSGSKLVVPLYELQAGVPWPAVTPSVMRYLVKTGEEYASRRGTGAFESLGLHVGTEHPAYMGMRHRLPQIDGVYAWYVRVPDVPGFLRRVAPVLEHRLAGSFAAGHTGDLKISFVSDGVRLRFEGGRLAEVDRWKPSQADSRLWPKVRDALFPSLTFLQVLFGFRSVEEVEHAYPDCVLTSEMARDLLNALFPKRVSRLWGVE